MDELTEQQERELIEHALQGARPQMEKAMGLTPRAYDKADNIADGIARGIRRGLQELGLRPKA